jgi:hypothetical protein
MPYFIVNMAYEIEVSPPALNCFIIPHILSLEYVWRYAGFWREFK